MVTRTHEAHHSIFRHDDDLFPEVMERVFGVVLGKAAQVTCLSTELTERQPLERRADSVLLAELLVEDEGSKYIVVVEAQTDPYDKKSWSWPYYIAYLRARYECPVICWWCARSWLPSNGRGRSFWRSLTRRGPTSGSPRSRHSRTVARDSYEIWRDLMITSDYPHVSQWRAQATELGREQGIEQGREQGIGLGSVTMRVADILRILARRKVSVPKKARKDIEACTDMHTLDTWFDRALVIDDIRDLFK